VELFQSPETRDESLILPDRVEDTSTEDLFGPSSDNEMEPKDALVVEREEHEIDELESTDPSTLRPASPNKKGKSNISLPDLIDEDIDELMEEELQVKFLSAPRSMGLEGGDIEEILEEGTGVNPMQTPIRQIGIPPAAFRRGLQSLASPSTAPNKTVASQIPSFEAVSRQTQILIGDESEKRTGFFIV
jgi:hypothetical protein